MLENLELPNTNAWASLLGLLSPWEYFVTIDHSVLWQRHVAWAKPKGEELGKYVTQRFASNMVVLSLMLGAQINVFFNSSKELTEMRSLMGQEEYGRLKYWIGILIALDSVVTIMALVATFTLWGMISAISDTNTHALLRSSIGQYVISLPPRFVVAALYLFVFWLFLFFMEIVSGPFRIPLAIVVLFLFFEVVVPLSAFGRLIIHTGAMARRRVLEEDLEKELLPSGLHGALLIRATGQRRKYTSAIHQYRKKSKKALRTTSLTNDSDHMSNASFRSVPARFLSDSRPHPLTATERDTSLNDHDEQAILETARLLGGPTPTSQVSEPTPSSRNGHKRTQSGDAFFPRASVLNSVSSTNLQDVVAMAIGESERGGFDDGWDNESKIESPHPLVSPEMDDIHVNSRDNARHVAPVATVAFDRPDSSQKPRVFDFQDDVGRVESKREMFRAGRAARGGSTSASRRQSALLGRRASSRAVIVEWGEESEVRDLYQVSPPAAILEQSESMEEEPEPPKETRRRTPRVRPSFLNRNRGLRSLRDLVTLGGLGTPDSSDGEGEEKEDPERGPQRNAGERAVLLRGSSAPTTYDSGKNTMDIIEED